MSGIASAHRDATLHTRNTLMHGLESQIGDLRRQRVARRLGEVLFFALLWAAGIAAGLIGLATTGWPGGALRLTSIIASAAALNAFYLLSHEGHHHLLFRGAVANHASNILLCLPLLHSPSAYRVLHELHHRYLGGPGDPDEYSNYTDDARLRWALQWVRLTLGTLVYMPLIPVVAWRRAGRADRWRIGIEYTAMLAAWTPMFVVVPIRVPRPSARSRSTRSRSRTTRCSPRARSAATRSYRFFSSTKTITSNIICFPRCRAITCRVCERCCIRACRTRSKRDRTRVFSRTSSAAPCGATSRRSDFP